MKKPSLQKGFTWVEVLIAIFVLLVLLGVLALIGASLLNRGSVSSPLNNMKQLHLATQALMLDQQTTGGKPDNWTCADDGTPLSFDQWRKMLVPAYLSERDFQKLLWPKNVGGFWGPIKIENMIVVFTVTEQDLGDTVFLATKNWHGIGQPLSGKPYGTKGFMVFRKGGDGAILLANRATDTNLIGTGGMHNFLPLK